MWKCGGKKRDICIRIKFVLNLQSEHYTQSIQIQNKRLVLFHGIENGMWK